MSTWGGCPCTLEVMQYPATYTQVSIIGFFKWISWQSGHIKDAAQELKKRVFSQYVSYFEKATEATSRFTTSLIRDWDWTTRWGEIKRAPLVLIWRISCKFDTSEVNVKVFEEGVLGLDLVRRYQILQHVVFNGTVSSSWRNVSWTENYFVTRTEKATNCQKCLIKTFTFHIFFMRV